MRMKVFAVYDKAVSLFLPPVFFRAEAEAVRALSVAMKGEHAFAQSPNDYVLYELTEWSEESGSFLPRDEPPRLVCELSRLLKED